MRASPCRSTYETSTDSPSSSAVLAVAAAFDFAFYRRWTFPPLRFLYFNLAQSLAVFYGRNPWHYYLLQGYPLLLTVFLPFAATGVVSALVRPAETYPAAIAHQLATISIVLPVLLSLVSHKEVRFIYPLLPPLHVLAAGPFATFFAPILARPPSLATILHRRFPLLLLALLAGTLTALLASTAHQPATLALMPFLRRAHEAHRLTQPPAAAHLAPPPPAADPTTVAFLTPCHSTPWRAHLVHPGIRAWALTCEPPVNLSLAARARYVDEADRFYADPKAWIRTHMGRPPTPRTRGWFGARPPRAGLGALDSGGADGHGEDDGVAWDGKEGRHPWPEYLVFFEGLTGTLREMGAERAGYHECWRGWNSWAHDDWRRRGDLVVWCVRGGEGGRSGERGAVRVA